jgi:hypothetical protein
MNKLIPFIALSIFLFSCNTGTKSNEEIKSITFEELTASADGLNEQLVSIEGIVTHVCKHGGQKLFLTDETKELNLLVKVTESIPEFDVALEGSTVQITGKVIITVAEVKEEGHNHGDGEEHVHSGAEGSHEGEEEADCATEEALKEKGEGDACTSNITYHIDATSFKEIVE